MGVTEPQLEMLHHQIRSSIRNGFHLMGLLAKGVPRNNSAIAKATGGSPQTDGQVPFLKTTLRQLNVEK